MTNEELDVLVAEKVLGLAPCKAWQYSNMGAAGGALSENRGCEHGAKCYPADPKLPRANYSLHLMATWQMEEELFARGLHAEYGDHLARLAQEGHAATRHPMSHPPINWLCAHAPARTRCLAALLAVGAEVE